MGKKLFQFSGRARHAARAIIWKVLAAKALEGVKEVKPDLVAVSAGFDAYADDPLAQETLEAEDYHWLGAESSASSACPHV